MWRSRDDPGSGAILRRVVPSIACQRVLVQVEKAASLRIGTREFAWGTRTYVMGVLNATPDSFSGDGVAADREALERRVRVLVDGAPDVIDIGGESTRPGAAPVDAETELARVLPAIEAVRTHDLDMPISIDTRKAVVAERAIVAGADAINDVSGLRDDPEMAELAAGTGVPVVLMHSRRARAVTTELGGQYRGVRYDDVAGDVMREGLELVDVALAAGIARQALVFDPGIGFGKTPAQNVELLRKLETRCARSGCRCWLGVAEVVHWGTDGSAAGGQAGRVVGGGGVGSGEGCGHGAGTRRGGDAEGGSGGGCVVSIG